MITEPTLDALPTIISDESADWWAEASCRGGDGSLAPLFFSEELQDIARAKTICSECPVIAPCLEGALTRREPWGVWGGQLFLNDWFPASSLNWASLREKCRLASSSLRFEMAEPIVSPSATRTAR